MAAEYIKMDSNRACKLPDNTSFKIVACLGIPVMTAHHYVFFDGSVEDKMVLVTGGAGRVGYYAIQWARQLVKRLMRDCVVNHRLGN
jgi:NADPH2:quinone reductase